MSKEARQKLSIANKGKTISEEQKKQISDAKKLRDKLRPMSEETKRKISETLRRKATELKSN